MSGIDGETRWQRLRREDVLVAARRDAVIVQPIGSIEQHGPHLPLDTDSYTSEAIALRAAAAAPFPVLVLPTVWWGVSEYWMGFGGTIALQPSVLADLLTDILGAVARNGFRRALLLNGHGGNPGTMHTVAVRLLGRGLKVVGLNYWSLVRDLLEEKSRADGGSIGHAGEVETSLQLALRADLVRPDLAPGEGTEMPRSALGKWAELVVATPDPALESPLGVYGAAAAASAAFGEEILEQATSRLVQLLDDFRIVPVSPASPLSEGAP
jgi:creatinine amidohydrolase